jgi:hypothetical protein
MAKHVALSRLSSLVSFLLHLLIFLLCLFYSHTLILHYYVGLAVSLSLSLSVVGARPCVSLVQCVFKVNFEFFPLVQFLSLSLSLALALILFSGIAERAR